MSGLDGDGPLLSLAEIIFFHIVDIFDANDFQRSRLVTNHMSVFSLRFILEQILREELVYGAHFESIYYLYFAYR